MLQKQDFEKQGCQAGKTKKIEEKLDGILYTRWVVEMEGVTLVNNPTLCMNATRHDVAVWGGTVHKELLAA